MQSINSVYQLYRGLASNEFERFGAGLASGNSLLTARGIPCSGEGTQRERDDDAHNGLV
jgi:hypothetical protein